MFKLKDISSPLLFRLQGKADKKGCHRTVHSLINKMQGNRKSDFMNYYLIQLYSMVVCNSNKRNIFLSVFTLAKILPASFIVIWTNPIEFSGDRTFLPTKIRTSKHLCTKLLCKCNVKYRTLSGCLSLLFACAGTHLFPTFF